MSDKTEKYCAVLWKTPAQPRLARPHLHEHQMGVASGVRSRGTGCNRLLQVIPLSYFLSPSDPHPHPPLRPSEHGLS